MRLLFAEDERDLNRILTKKLTEEGYSVDSCYDGVEAMDYLTAIHYDGVILDVMMPKADGFAVLENMRKQGIDTPVLFLTARDAVSDRVHGLDLGASDYLVKPFSMEELMARVRALTRRSYDTQSSTLTAADLRWISAPTPSPEQGRRSNSLPRNMHFSLICSTTRTWS